MWGQGKYDAAGVVSRLGMADNPDDDLEWETPLSPLTYQDEVSGCIIHFRQYHHQYISWLVTN